MVQLNISEPITATHIFSYNNGASLYLGNITDAIDRIESLNVQAVVRVLCPNMSKTIQLPEQYKHIEVLDIELYDSPQSDISTHFETSYNFINKNLERGKSVLVHCWAGVSRSATLVIYFLMKKHKLPLEEAHGYVLNKRCIVNPNQGFLKQLSVADIALLR